MSANTQKAAKSAAYARFGRVVGAGGACALLVSVALYAGHLWLVEGQQVSGSSSDWGTFGDFVGGIAGTFVALLTLLAIARTLELQAEELEATRTELENQTAAAREQVNQMREVEARRVRPLLKIEWFPEGPNLWFRIRNVGLGPCILDRIELRVDSEVVGEHSVADVVAAVPVWRAALEKLLGAGYPGNNRLRFLPWNDLMRVLAVNEHQAFMFIERQNQPGAVDEVFGSLQNRFRPVVHFRSIDNAEWSTTTQLN